MDGLIVGIIPARGGSKGIPRKNIQPLAGKPLISHTIDEALSAVSLDRVIVSTEDKAIAKVVAETGAEVLMRPPELAADISPALPVIQHAISEIEKDGTKVWATVYLQPTSPFRTADDIDNAVSILRKGAFNSVVSVKPLEINPYGILASKDGKMSFFLKDRPKRHPRRQDLPELYRFNGAIWATKREYSMSQHDHVIDPENTGIYVMPKDRSIDIDEPDDLMIAEILMSRRMK